MFITPTISSSCSQNPLKTLFSLFSYAKTLSQVQQLHAHVIINGRHKDVLYGSNIINSYVQSGSLPLATEAFHQITAKNLHSWNTIISGYSKYNLYGDVLRLFNNLRNEGNSVDSFNLVFAIKASQSLMLLPNGRLIHGLAIKSGLEADLFVVPALVEMYAELASLNDAHKLFERFSYRSSVLWGFMIRGYLKISQESRVFELFSDMNHCFGFQWDAFTMEGLVRACAKVLAGREGKACHSVCIRNNLLGNVCLQTTIVDMYMKCGFVHYAVRLFEEANNKDVVLWSAVINGCAKRGRFFEAMSLFKRMLENSVIPNPVTLVGLILACSGLGSLKQGKSVHGFVIRNKVELDVVNYTSLLDMYAKCGCVKTGLRVFSMMPAKNVVSWTAMINGCAMDGLCLEALTIFDQMIQNARRIAEYTPNSVTFVSALSACSHSGMVQEGWRIFNSMKDYAISPTEEHYVCMTEVLARAGQFDAALSFISDMPIKPGPNVWGVMLRACRMHKQIELAEEIVKGLSLIEEPNGSSSLHVLLSKVHANEIMTEEGYSKSLGFSSIEVNNKLCVFSSDGTPAFKSTEISHLWNFLSREMRESVLL